MKIYYYINVGNSRQSMKNKKILFIINGMGGGGAQRNIANLTKYFVENGAQVTILCLTDSLNFYDLPNSVKFIYAIGKFNNKIFNLKKWISSIKKSIKDLNIDTVIAVGVRYGVLTGLAVNKNVNFIIRGASTSKLTLLTKLGLFLIRKKIKVIVSQTKAQMRTYPNFLSHKIQVISNPFNVPNKNRNTHGYKSKKIITVGRLYLPHKHTDVIIKAYSIFNKKYPNYELFIYGEPQLNDNKTLPYLQHFIKELGAENKIHLVGMEKNLLDKIENDTFCFIFASSLEGMPNALIEAKMLGIPCITTNWEGCNEIIDENEKDGFIVNIGDEKAIADKMAVLVSNEKLYNNISKNGYMSCIKFKADKIYKRWKQII